MDAAAQGYGQGADLYGRARPGYPDEAIQALFDGLGLRPGKHVVDLGAGTGIFTRQLAEQGLRVTAVEPVDAMRHQIVAAAGIEVCAGTAEDTGLQAGVADAVVAATAWHWFDAPRAMREVERLLRSGAGGLGLLWNGYDETVPWVAEFASIAYGRRPATVPSGRSAAWRNFFGALYGWTPLEERQLPHQRTTTPNGVIDRLLSSSAIAVLPDAEREQARREAWGVMTAYDLAKRASLVLPYTTSVYWTCRR